MSFRYILPSQEGVLPVTPPTKDFQALCATIFAYVASKSIDELSQCIADKCSCVSGLLEVFRYVGS